MQPQEKPMGEVTDSTDPADFDDTTIAGAIENHYFLCKGNLRLPGCVLYRNLCREGKL